MTEQGYKRHAGPFEGGKYVRVALARLMERAQNESYDRATRVEFAMMAAVNQSGHAQFASGELAFILGGEHNGAWTPASGSRVSNAIRKAKERGAIAPESNSRCLVTTGGVDQGLETTGCYVHHLRPGRKNQGRLVRPNAMALPFERKP